MEDLKYSLFDFPDNPSDMNWKNEAVLFYYYMLRSEKKYEKEIHTIFEEFKKLFSKKYLIPSNKEREIFNLLKLNIYELKNKDNKFPRTISFITLISTVITKLEKKLSIINSSENSVKVAIIVGNIDKDYLKTQLEKLGQLKENSFSIAEHEVVRIVRTESWRLVNETRLEEFIKKGYKYKTTYPVKDSKTGEDSRYYYDTHQIKPVSEPFSYIWEGKQRVFMTPPDRPNDRNILIPHID